jgi:hypothetical protein
VTSKTSQRGSPSLAGVPELTAFQDANPDFDILTADLLHADAVERLNWQGPSQTSTLALLRAYQRLLRIEPDVTVATALYKEGIDSAGKLTSINRTQFVRMFEGQLTQGAAQAGQIYDSATNVKSRAMHMAATVHGISASPHFRAMTVNHVSTELTSYFQSLSSYDQMFGSLDYCKCEACASILGPAAYLVDLLRIIDLAVTVPNTSRPDPTTVAAARAKYVGAGIAGLMETERRVLFQQNIPPGLSLEERRPDLGKIALTCANTNELVPYLQIVNAVLQQTVERALGTAGALQGGNLYVSLANTFYPFRLPLNLELERIRRYIGASNSSLTEIYSAFSAANRLSLEEAREVIGGSAEQITNLAPSPVTQLPAILSQNYGLALSPTDLAGLDSLDTFVNRTGLSLSDVQTLFTQNLSSKELFDTSGIFQLTGGKGTRLTLTQQGNRVSGSYDYASGQLQAIVHGFVLRGVWQEIGAASGSFELIFTPDGSAFEGAWSAEPGGTGTTAAWSGKRDAATPSTAGIIPHSLFVNHVLGPRQYLQIMQDTSVPESSYSRIQNQSLATLDTINRFVRLAQALGWSWSDLDWTLTTLSSLTVDDQGNIASPTELSGPTIVELAKVKRLLTGYGLPLGLATALWFDLKTVGCGDSEASTALFDTVFNAPSRLAQCPGLAIYHPRITPGASSYPNPLYTDAPLRWTIGSSSQGEDAASLIVASIPAAADEILAVAEAAFGSNTTIDLTVSNLSLLYRHTMLARKLGWRVSSYVKLLHLLGFAAGGRIAGTLDRDQALAVMATAEWIAGATIQVEQIDYVVTGSANAAAGPGYDPSTIPAFLTALTQVIRPSLAGAGLFASQMIEQDLSAAIYRLLLNQGYIDPAGVIVTDAADSPPDLSRLSDYAPHAGSLSPAQREFIVTKLIQQRTEQHRHLYTQLGSLFGISADMMGTLAAGATLWRRQHDALEPFVLDPLVDAGVTDVLAQGALDLAGAIKIFNAHGITLSITAQIEPLTVFSWNISATVAGSATEFRAVSDDLSTVSFFRKLDGGAVFLFQVSGAEALTANALDATKLMALFQGHAVTLDGLPSVSVIVQPAAWTITDASTGAVYWAAKPENDKGSIRFWTSSAATSVTPSRVTSILDQIGRFLALQRALSLSTSATAVVVQAPTAFRIADDHATPLAFTLDAVSQVYRFTRLLEAVHDNAGGLAAYLEMVRQPDVTQVTAVARLCGVTGWDSAQCSFLCGTLFGAGSIPGTFDQIDRLARIFAIAAKVGVDIYTLNDLNEARGMQGTSGNWATMTGLADRLLQAMRAHTVNEAWPARFAELNGPIEEAKRDALVSTAIWQLGQRMNDITSPRALYEYLLLDVEMAGCAQISVIKEALNAAQLYLQRCRLNLERNVAISTHDLHNAWWAWLLDYRVWQANRMIFLYPENYVDPSLRKNKTQPFQNLENALRQGRIVEDTVDAAFRAYLDELTQIAKLVPVDAYHAVVYDENRGDIETLFLFGRTDTQPYKFYYATRQRIADCEDGSGEVWSEWLPIGISISAPYVAPIFVFNKLFIFWVELIQKKELDGSTDGTKRFPITQASIRLSYRNFSGNWMPPQTVVANQVVNVEAQPLYGPFLNLFADPKTLWWSRVAVLRVPAASLPSGGEVAEKLALYYGPLFDSSSYAARQGSPPTISSDSPDALDFLDTISEAEFICAQLGGLNQRGKVPILPFLVLDSNLERSSLTFDNQYPLVAYDTRTTASPPTFRAGLNGRSLVIQSDRRTLYSQYITGMSIEAIPIDPVPGGALDRNDFVSDIVPGAQSSQFFTILTGRSDLINPEGRVDVPATKLSTQLLATILNTSPTIAREVRERLLTKFFGTPVLLSNISTRNAMVVPVRNQPGEFIFRNGDETFLITAGTPAGAMFPRTDASLRVATSTNAITPAAFVTRDINADLSRQLFQKLSRGGPGGYLGGLGIVNKGAVERVEARTLAEFLQIDLGRAQQVLDVLRSGFGPASLSYTAGGFQEDVGIHSLQFSFTRLSTGAMPHLSAALHTSGIEGLLALPMQQLPVTMRSLFDRLGLASDKAVASNAGPPSLLVVPPAARYAEQVDFGGPYGTYFWELFFHAPLLVANMLRDNQRFQDAEKWFQYIFNPTLPSDPLTRPRFAELMRPMDIDPTRAGPIFDGLSDPTNLWINEDGAVTPAALTAPLEKIMAATNTTPFQALGLKNLLVNRYLATSTARYWQFQPFRNHTLESFKAQLQNCAEIAAYNDDPFDPHAIARLRIGAYEKATVMAYIGNLLDWGDQQFTRYTWESITAARMLYSYAHDLLGRRPQDVGPCAEQFAPTFDDILARYGSNPHSIPQFLIDMENALGGGQARGPLLRTAGQPFNDLSGVFCVPENAQLLALWDRVEDRLYKIRNCLNILGQRQPLPIFEPPINPADLVRAAAEGGAFAGLESQLQPLIPSYRFSVMIERAEDVTEAVRSFGAALLGVLERRDSEGLGLLRAAQEIGVLNLVTSTKQQAIAELQEQLLSLQQGLASARHRADYYARLISNGLNAAELATLALMTESLLFKLVAVPLHGLSIGGYLAPTIFGLANGGSDYGGAIGAGASVASMTSEMLDQSAAIAQTFGQNQRRDEEWNLQKQLAEYEVEELDHQFAAVNIQLAAAQQDLAINRQEIANANQVQTVLQRNFTNQQLYQWMVGRISVTYFQAFRLAQDLALAAQSAYQFELDRDDQCIAFGTWDDLRQGLLAGDGLLLALKQLRKRYLDNNSRGFEIEKTISLRQTFPQAFLGFKRGYGGGDRNSGMGQLDFTLAESLFDFDYPGHYSRKIKSISLSLPSVIGPYQDFHATLTQHSNLIVLKPDVTAVDYAIARTSASVGTSMPTPLPGSVREGWKPNQSIAVSRGIDDSGLFALDFGDERYLPYEGTGAVSSWTFSMPPETNRISFENISDVILKVRYTAKEGGAAFASKVRRLYAQAGDRYAYLNAAVLNLNQTFSGQWAQVFATSPVNGQQTLNFPITRSVIPPNLGDVKLHAILLQVVHTGAAPVSSAPGKPFISLQIGGNPSIPVPIPITNNFGELTQQQVEAFGQKFTDQSWSLSFTVNNVPGELLTQNALDRDKLRDVSLIVMYSAKPFGTS